MAYRAMRGACVADPAGHAFLRKPQRWRPEINLLLVYRDATLPDILMMSSQGIFDEEVVLTQFNRNFNTSTRYFRALFQVNIFSTLVNTIVVSDSKSPKTVTRA